MKVLRRTYVIEAENGVGVYLSKYSAEKRLQYLNERGRCITKFTSYDEAKDYVFSRYCDDAEIDLSIFRANYTIYRDVSGRFNFYVWSPNYIGFGINKGMRLNFQTILQISTDEICEAESTNEAEYYARRGFAEKYKRPEFFYTGPLLPGESLSFAEMVRYNRLDVTCEDMSIKIRGISLLPPAVK